MMTMTYVLDVKTSMKAAKLEFRTSMLWKDAASLLHERGRNYKTSDVTTRKEDVSTSQTHLQLSLNCLMMLLIFSKR